MREFVEFMKEQNGINRNNLEMFKLLQGMVTDLQLRIKVLEKTKKDKK